VDTTDDALNVIYKFFSLNQLGIFDLTEFISISFNLRRSEK